MRRLTTAVLALLALLLATALAACGSSDDSQDAQDVDTGGGTFPVSVSTMFGDVTVPSAPKKIVALGWADAETLYALGVQPIAMSDWLAFGDNGVGPWADSSVKTEAKQLGTMQLDYQAILALKPDLILNTRSDNSKETFEKLSNIAPTIYAPTDTIPYGTSWQTQIETISKAVGKSEAGAKLIAETEEKFAAAKQKFPGLAGKTAAVGTLYGTDQWGAYVSGDLRVDFLTELGMVSKPAIEELKKDSFYVSVSGENLQLLDADLTLLFALGDNHEALVANPVIRNLNSTKAGHTLVLDAKDASAFSTGSVTAIQYALEQVLPKIAKAAGVAS